MADVIPFQTIWSIVALCSTISLAGGYSPSNGRLCDKFSLACQNRYETWNQVNNSRAIRRDNGAIPSLHELNTVYYCHAFRPTYRVRCGLVNEPRSRGKRFDATSVNRLTYDIETRENVCEHYKEYYRVNCSVNGGENDTVRSYCDLYRELCNTLQEDKISMMPSKIHHVAHNVATDDDLSTIEHPEILKIVESGGKLTLAPTTAGRPTTTTTEKPSGFRFGLKVPVLSKRKKLDRKKKKNRKNSIMTRQDQNPYFCSYFEGRCRSTNAYDAGLLLEILTPTDFPFADVKIFTFCGNGLELALLCTSSMQIGVDAIRVDSG
uniref:Uncharacterized protein n=1 Tax=Romanomermis culicivorax TaxID=13658 RepID=A0A915IA20_ROMCU